MWFFFKGSCVDVFFCGVVFGLLLMMIIMLIILIVVSEYMRDGKGIDLKDFIIKINLLNDYD